MPLFTFEDLQQQQEQETESPWSILDPSLKKQQSLYWNPSSAITATKKTYLDFPIINYQQEQQQQRYILKEKSIFDQEKKEKEEEGNVKLQDYLKEIEEIETELFYHRNSIYFEKLKVLQDELLSIEKGTHKYILKQDKKFKRKRDKEITSKEAMYHYQLEAIDKQVQHEKKKILQDIESQAGFARRVLTSESGSLLVLNGSSNATSIKKRKEKSPSAEDDELSAEEEQPQQPTGFKKIHLKKKIGKLQAIHDRQRAVKLNKIKNTEDALNHQDEDELDNDLILIKKNISSAAMVTKKL